MQKWRCNWELLQKKRGIDYESGRELGRWGDSERESRDRGRNQGKKVREIKQNRG